MDFDKKRIAVSSFLITVSFVFFVSNPSVVSARWWDSSQLQASDQVPEIDPDQETPEVEVPESDEAEAETPFFQPPPNDNQSQDEERASNNTENAETPEIAAQVEAAEEERPNVTALFSHLILDKELPIADRREAANLIAPALGIAEDSPDLLERVAEKLSDGLEIFEVKTESGSVYCASRDCISNSESPSVLPAKEEDPPAAEPHYEIDEVADGDKEGQVYLTIKIENPSTSPSSQAQIIQQAIDKAASSGGGVVYLPPGVYVLDKSISLKDNVDLIGSGQEETIIKMADNFPHENSGFLKNGTQSKGNISIRDLGLEGADDDPALHERGCAGLDDTCTSGLRLNGLSGVIIANVQIAGFSRDGIYIGEQKGRPSTDIRLSEVNINNNGRNGISLVYADNVTIDRSNIKNNALGIPEVGVGQLVFEPESGNSVSNVRVIDTFVDGDPGRAAIFIFEYMAGEGSVHDNLLCNVISLNFISTGADIPTADSPDQCIIGEIPPVPVKRQKTAESVNFFDFVGLIKEAFAAENPFLMNSDLYELKLKTDVLKEYKQIFGEPTDLFLARLMNVNLLDQEIKADSTGNLILKTAKTGIFQDEIPASTYTVSVDTVPGYSMNYPKRLQISGGENKVIPVAVSKGATAQKKIAKPQLLSLDFLTRSLIGEVRAKEGDGAITAFGFADTNGNGDFDKDEEILPWAKLTIKLKNESFVPPFFKIHVP